MTTGGCSFTSSPIATPPYRFDHTDSGDFIAQHFFTGGVMPSHGLIRQFADVFAVEQEWTWNGGHYARTANDWLANMDRKRPADRGVDAPDLWRRRQAVDTSLAAVLPGDGPACSATTTGGPGRSAITD